MTEKLSEQTWDDVENRWRIVDEILERHNLKSTSDPIPGEADWVHAMDVADKIVEFEIQLDAAAEKAFISEIVQTEMLEHHLSELPGISTEQFKTDWKEDWINSLVEN